MTRQTPATRATPEALAAIDATVDGRCACGCGRQLDPAGPSGWFAHPNCQRRFHERQATDPRDVYRRPDAAAYPPSDSARVPLTAALRSPADLAATLADLQAGFAAASPRFADVAAALRRGLVHVPRGPAADRVLLDDPAAACCAAGAVAGPGPCPWHDPPPGVRALLEAAELDRLRRVFAPVPRAVRIPMPPPPTTVDWQREQRLRSEPGWQLADAGPVRWRRRCGPCGRFVLPWMGLPLERVTFVPDGHVVPVIEFPQPRQTCPDCRTDWPGPPLLAQWQEVSRYRYALRLAAAGSPVCLGVSYVNADDAAAMPNLVDLMWENVEREILDLLTFRDPCAVCAMQAGADVPRARSRFRFEGRVAFAAVPAGSLNAAVLVDTEAGLCPAHESELLGMLDERTCVPVYREAGIVTSVPPSRPAEPGEVWANVQRIYRQLGGC